MEEQEAERTLKSSGCGARDMEEQEAGHKLPEALVEKVIAMMPFPSIFKARSLSKSWLARLSSTSSQKGSEKSLATLFQKQVGEWSSKWETFSPVLVTTEDIMAYNQTTQSWSKLPLVSFLPANWFLRNLRWQIEGPLLYGNLRWQIEGPLLYGFAPPQTGFNNMEIVVVGNILTRSWRQLPPRPNGRVTTVVCDKLVIYPALEKYKVILFCAQTGCFHHYCAEVYDSKSNAWSSKSFVVSSQRPSAAAYLNGVLYMVGVSSPERLLAFKVEEGTLEELRLSSSDNIVVTYGTLNIVVCNFNWLMVVIEVFDYENAYGYEFFRIDLGSLRLSRLAQGPPLIFMVGRFHPPVGHGNHIFFNDETGCSQVLAYNVDKEVWSYFPVPICTCNAQRTYDWLESSFQPGFSPFVAV